MSTPALLCSGLTRRFGARVAVDSLDLCVQPGDTYGFLGPNGAGKTTAIRCMLGLIKQDAGRVELLGSSHPVHQRRNVGSLVETPTFHEWMSGRANLVRSVAYAGLGDAQEIDRSLHLVGLGERGDERVGTYSLGMRQRLGIARALVGRPKLLILDEPTNGLDPRGMKEVRDLLKGLAKQDGLTIFISSHLLAEVELLCNRVGIIERGKLIAEGTVAELVAGRSGGQEVDIGAADVAQLSAALVGITGASSTGVLPDGRTRVLLEGLTVSELNRALVQAEVQVDALVPVTHSLEDIFLKLTTAEIT
jgi:ABC-2 type transport system ATP-binding protein